jgi:hypothetical protein
MGPAKHYRERVAGAARGSYPGLRDRFPAGRFGLPLWAYGLVFLLILVLAGVLPGRSRRPLAAGSVEQPVVTVRELPAKGAAVRIAPTGKPRAPRTAVRPDSQSRRTPSRVVRAGRAGATGVRVASFHTEQSSQEKRASEESDSGSRKSYRRRRMTRVRRLGPPTSKPETTLPEGFTPLENENTTPVPAEPAPPKDDEDGTE